MSVQNPGNPDLFVLLDCALHQWSKINLMFERQVRGDVFALLEMGMLAGQGANVCTGFRADLFTEISTGLAAPIAMGRLPIHRWDHDLAQNHYHQWSRKQGRRGHPPPVPLRD